MIHRLVSLSTDLLTAVVLAAGIFKASDIYDIYFTHGWSSNLKWHSEGWWVLGVLIVTCVACLTIHIVGTSLAQSLQYRREKKADVL